MKTIQPVSIWENGQIVNAQILNSYVVNDNLSTSANFFYALFAENQDGTQGQQVTQGNLTMTGQAYLDYETNNYAWDWVASSLNLTITGNYVPPVPTTTTTTTLAPDTTTTTTIAP